MPNLKHFHVLIASNGKWARNRSLLAALRDIDTRIGGRTRLGRQVKLYTAICSAQTTDEDLDELVHFFGVDGMGNFCRSEDLTPEEKSLISSNIIGWTFEFVDPLAD